MRRYDAVLDVISAVQHYPEEGWLLAAATQAAALAYLNRKAEKHELWQLLRLARDLGLLEDEVFAALRI